MDYETLPHVFADTWGLLLVLVCPVRRAYAFWPGNRDKFEHAARLPKLDEELAL